MVYVLLCETRDSGWLVRRVTSKDARDGGCRGHVVIDTADDDAVRVSTEAASSPPRRRFLRRG